MGSRALRIKRVYEAPEPEDGWRVLVDRLWPRGVSKARAAVDLWAKDVAPSPELRTWWQHDPERFAEFADRYRAELSTNPAIPPLLERIGREPATTLLFAAHDPLVNHAAVLRDFLD